MNTGIESHAQCPNCGAPSNWEVEECDACGYESKTLRRWRREARRQQRRDERDGCLSALFDSMFWLDGIVELTLLLGRGLTLLVRAIWGLVS